jgi:hypothetical protein
MKKKVRPVYPPLQTAPREARGESQHRARGLVGEDDYAFRDLLVYAI